jgi:alginate O-acetyltransferase complex protein AlgI
MLFTTATFAFLFLPIALIGYYLLGARSQGLTALWLFLASLFFYGYWLPEFTLLLLLSIGGNFACGWAIARAAGKAKPPQKTVAGKAWLVAGIVFNLGLLGYFKYANFFVDNLNAVFGTGWDLAKVILPIGISFYSFTQIAYLVDVWRGLVHEHQPIRYGLFVSFFPQLVAGPVLHHSQMMPQFAQASVYRFDAGNFCGGLVIFGIGLFKKIVLADGIAPYADAVFVPADGGALPTTTEAWVGALAYTAQLYFDFSAYSDMAIGLSWMFNIRIPYNFNSPYKALSITDFWRRWHMTLSTFLRDYLYVPLGGNRRGKVRRYVNLGLTMVLGGLWHGAGWTFVLWGALHGGYLMVNHAFRASTQRLGIAERLGGSRTFALASWTLTFLCVVIAWVFFRAETLDGAVRIVSAMFGLRPAAAPMGTHPLLWNAGLPLDFAIGWIAGLTAMAVLLPNSNAIGERALALFRDGIRLRQLAGGAALAVCAMLVVLNSTRDAVSAFIYFNF